MCGIAGWLGYVNNGEKVASRIMQLMHHRGPDMQGFRQWPQATLVHTRLSIIDLSFDGVQPMFNERQNICTVLNGEIYNHRHLRSELEIRGHKFKGYSDAEVLPHLYEEFGKEFVKKLRGMFAIALYDSENKTLILARDRLGIKPLFYAPGAKMFAFASEIKALSSIPEVDFQPNPQAIYDFAALLFIPAPDTFYQQIKAVQPSELIEVQIDAKGRVEYHASVYHRWAIASNSPLKFSEVIERSDDLIKTAVKQQWESDVPLGILLSGGLDSSLISVAAKKSGVKDIQTFNVQFPDNNYDETWAAQAIAKHIGSNHMTLKINRKEGSWEYVTNMLLCLGQPFADTSLFAVNAICQLAKQYVTVAISGDGGDEVFSGYYFYGLIPIIERLQRLPLLFWRCISNCLAPLNYLTRLDTSLFQRIHSLTGVDDSSIVQNLFCWLSEIEHRNLCLGTHLLPIRRLFEPQWEYSSLPKRPRFERLFAHATEVNIRLLLPNDFLFKVDMASMRESLEVRIPMLDENLVEFGLKVPCDFKVKGMRSKVILREIAKKELPSRVARKRKQGFGIPVDIWVDMEFKTLLRETLLNPSSCLQEFFRKDIYRLWVEAFCQDYSLPGISRVGLYQRVIMLLALHLALDRKDI